MLLLLLLLLRINGSFYSHIRQRNAAFKSLWTRQFYLKRARCARFFSLSQSKFMPHFVLVITFSQIEREIPMIKLMTAYYLNASKSRKILFWKIPSLSLFVDIVWLSLPQDKFVALFYFDYVKSLDSLNPEVS